MRLTIAILASALLLGSAIASHAIEKTGRNGRRPLHQAIDQMIAAGAPNFAERASPPSSDAQFIRRVFLDLVGRIPDSQQAREFLDSTASDKRKKLIDSLLASPEHVRHMQQVFDVMLMERLPATHIPQAQWRDYLYGAFRENKTWIQLTRELLTSDGDAEGNRPAARFLLDRQLSTEEAAIPIGRILLGRDLTCAECHDHPEVAEYLQRHVFGIWAFLDRTYLFEDPQSALTSFGEKATGDVEFTSALTLVKSTTLPRILDLPSIEDPPLASESYSSEPSDDVRGIPMYSRRLQLHSAIADSNNMAFRLNIANRLWAMLMGRGLVEPVDMFHATNPPSHPELLDLLAGDLLENDYDMRRVIRAIVLSETYQRSSKRIGGEESAPPQYDSALWKPLSPEQLAWSMMQATGVVEQTRTAVAERLGQESAARSSGSSDYDFELEKACNDELLDCVAAFVEAFAPGDEFSLTDDSDRQDTFLERSPLLTEWLEPTDKSLVGRLQKIANASSLAEELYMAVFTRTPTEAETQSVCELLASPSEELEARLQRLVRMMLSSAEFRFNH